MDDHEKLLQFEDYMREKNLTEEKISYNLKVVNLLVTEVLFVFQQDLSTIDSYCFEEFTDMITLINEELGGREGIKTIMEAMLLLTEFLKENKYIRGGKIAFYRRMFTKTDYYIDKYDMMTGKKDDSKGFIKKIINNQLCQSIIKEIEEVNVYDYDTISKVDKLLNDVPFGKNGSDSVTDLLRCMLLDLNLLEYKEGQLITTKKGRAFSRLGVDERFGALIYLIIELADWNHIIMLDGIKNSLIEFSKFKNAIVSVFNSAKEVHINLNDMKNINQDHMLIEIASERFRTTRAEAMTCGMQLMDIVFIGLGLIDFRTESNGEVIYSVTELGEGIIKLLYNDTAWYMRSEIGTIGSLIEYKKYEAAENYIIEFLSIFGPNLKIWCYLGQLLILKKQYKYAYNVLKHAYENSSKRGKTSKTVLYYLVMCCRKLKLGEDLKNYELKLMSSDKN